MLRVSSTKDQGFDQLWAAVLAVPRRKAADHDGRELLRRAQELLAERFGSRAEQVGPVVDRWQRQELDEAQAANELLQALVR